MGSVGQHSQLLVASHLTAESESVTLQLLHHLLTVR